jgi:hypothetical protein
MTDVKRWANWDTRTMFCVDEAEPSDVGGYVQYVLASDYDALRAEVGRLRGLLREARDSVRNHWRKHLVGLRSAIRKDRLEIIAIETKREAELRDLRDRIDAALAVDKP